MGSPSGGLGSAFVAIRARTTQFAQDARRGIQNAIRAVASRINFGPITTAAQNGGVQAGQHLGNGIYRGADGRLRDLRGRFVSEGALAGQLFSNAFQQTADLDRRGGFGLGGLTVLMNKFTLAALGAAKALPVVIALVAELGSVGVAAAASLPFLITSLLVIKETFNNAFKGVGDAVKAAFEQDPAKLQQALEDLTPAARAFVLEIAKAAPVLEAVQKDIQEKFFRPLRGGFDALRTSGIIGDLGRSMAAIATQGGTVAKVILEIFTASAASGQFRTILGQVVQLFTILSPLLPGLVVAFLDLAAAAGPFVNLLAGRFAAQVERFFNFLAEAMASGALQRGFDSALTTISALGDLLGNILSILGDVFGALSADGESVLGVFASLTGQIADFFNSFAGQQVLGQLASLLDLVTDSVINLVTPLLPVLAALVTAIAGPLRDALATVAPPLTRLVDSLAKALLPVIERLAPVMALFVEAVATTLADVLVLIADEIYELTPAIVAFFDVLGPAAVTVVEAFALVLQELVPILPELFEAFEELVPVLIELLPLVTHFSTIFAGILVILAGVIEFLVPVIGWLARTGAAIAEFFLRDFLGSLLELFEFFEEATAAIDRFFTETLPAFLDGGEARFTEFTQFLGRLPAVIAAALSNLAGALIQPFTAGFTGVNSTVSGGVGRIGEAIGAIPGYISSFAGRIFDAASRIGRSIGDGIANIPGAAVNIAQRIVNRIRGFVNDVIYDINRGIYNLSRFLPFTPPYIPYLAEGGIINSPTMAVLGEAGREVVLPLTDPARTRELAAESGLMDILGPSLGGQGVPNVLVFIGDDEITDRVDVRVQYALDGQARELSFGSRGI